MNIIDRFLQRTIVAFSAAPGRPPTRRRDEIRLPGERDRVPLSRRLLAYGLAVLLPTAVAAALIPFRVDHGRVAVLILVLPVVAVALVGATGPAIVAALTAAIAYDLFLVEPYYRLTIDDPDELAAAAALAIVGLVVGVLNTRLLRLTARDTTRGAELRHLNDYVRVATTTTDVSELSDEACRHLSAVLNLRACQWAPGYQGRTSPVLLSDGSVMGFVTALNADRAMLPEQLELPAVVDNAELGRFILTCTSGHPSSIEERLSAISIARLHARALERIAVTPP